VDAAGNLFAVETDTCRRCKSPLTNDVSRARHYGPECWKNL
jgi:hypothetical protein